MKKMKKKSDDGSEDFLPDEVVQVVGVVKTVKS